MFKIIELEQSKFQLTWIYAYTYIPIRARVSESGSGIEFRDNDFGVPSFFPEWISVCLYAARMTLIPGYM